MDSEIIREETKDVSSVDMQSETGEEIGNIKISVDVISTIAGLAASEIRGVNGMYTSFASGIAERFGAKKNVGKGVRVEMAEESVIIDLYIVVDYGVRIPELAWEVQENVKNNVETMTGMSVEKVNIHIEGVSFEKEAEAAKEAETVAVPQPAPVIEIDDGDALDEDIAD